MEGRCAFPSFEIPQVLGSCPACRASTARPFTFYPQRLMWTLGDDVFLDSRDEIGLEIRESDERIIPLIVGATLLVLVLAGVFVAVVIGRDPRNFGNLFGSPPGVWLIYASLAVAIPTQVAAIVLVVVLHRSRMRGELDLKRKRISVGKILGIIGGLIILVSVFLPWAALSQSGLSAGTIDPFVATLGFVGVFVLLFGIIGLEYVAIPTRGTALTGAVFGTIAFLLTLAVLGGSPSGYQISPAIGMYLSLIGSLILVGGSAFAYMEMKKASPGAPRHTPGYLVR